MYSLPQHLAPLPCLSAGYSCQNLKALQTYIFVFKGVIVKVKGDPCLVAHYELNWFL